MTAVKPGLVAVDLEARCACRCPRSGHRMVRPGVYGACRVHRSCGTFELDESAALFRPAVDPAVVCGCGASHGQHYADNGRMRGPRGCQDFHLKCGPLCKHAAPTLHRHAHGSPEAPVLADRSVDHRVHGYNHLTPKPLSAFQEPLAADDDLEVPDADEPAPVDEPAAPPASGGNHDDAAEGCPVKARRPRRASAASRDLADGQGARRAHVRRGRGA